MPQYKEGQTVRYKPVGGMYSYSPLCTLHSSHPSGPLLRLEIPLGPDSNTSESTGVVKSVLTEPGNQAGRNVQASEDDPRYEVRSPILLV